MEEKRENIVMTKSYAFALGVIALYKFLVADKKEFVLSKQLLRSGTAIGALINETTYWLQLLLAKMEKLQDKRLIFI